MALTQAAYSIEPNIPLDFVEGTVTHVVPNGAKPVINVVPPGAGVPKRLADYRPYNVRIHDARPIAADLSLDEEGVALVDHDTAVTDFYDDEEVQRVYYPEIERLLKEVTGAMKVVVFDHTTRAGGADSKPGDNNLQALRQPVRTVHNDYTTKSGPQRVRDLIDPEEADEWLNGRFAVINVWRPIRGPVEAMPLAVAEAGSMGPNDFVAADLVYEDRIGEIYDVAHNPDQRWLYFPKMRRDEAMLIKCYDSAEDGRARFTAHTAFDDPTTPANAPPRESIEIRTLVLFPPEDGDA